MYTYHVQDNHESSRRKLAQEDPNLYAESVKSVHRRPHGSLNFAPTPIKITEN